MNLSNSTNATHEQLCALPTQEKFQYQTAFLIFILILTFTGNVLVVLAVIFFRRLRSITNYFIVSLAVSDLLVAVISLPFRIDQTVHNIQWCLSYEACITWIITDTTCSFASIWNLAIISIDRYIAIVHPFRYHSVITNKVGYGLIGFAWSFSFLLAMLIFHNFTDPNEPHIFIAKECVNKDKIYYTFSAALSFFLPLCIVLVMYAFIFRVAFNQARAMAALQVTSSKRGRRSSINLVREVKAAKTLAIVVGCFVICWLPFTILVQISLWNKPLLFPLSEEEREGLSYTFAYVLPAVNSTLNPIIYALFNRDFRQAFLKLAKRITGQRLGAVGFGEASVATTTSVAPNGDSNHRSNRGIRFADQDSESSEVLPTIPMRDPNCFYDNNIQDSTIATDVPRDTNSMETSLDDTGHQHSITHDSERNDVDATQSNGTVGENVGEPSKRDMPQRLPPLERNVSKNSEEDDIDIGVGKLVKPLTLPPIESTINDELNHSPTEAKSEQSEQSTSATANKQEDECKESNRNDDES